MVQEQKNCFTMTAIFQNLLAMILECEPYEKKEGCYAVELERYMHFFPECGGTVCRYRKTEGCEGI